MTAIATIGHNQPPSDFDAIAAEINDLFDEAKTWADGVPIADEATHDAVTKIYDMIHDAGKRADALRVAEKKPLDEAVKEIQDRYNPFIQPKKGKVDLAKSSLSTLLAAYRAAKAQAARVEAERLAAIAAAEAEAARIALQASAGNLEARVEAEQVVDNAKAWGKAAARAEKAATVGLGLRAVWVATPIAGQEAARLDWAFARDPGRFEELCQQMANEAVRANVREIPGFAVKDEKRAV